MKKNYLLIIVLFSTFMLNAQEQVIFNGETVNNGWWVAGSTQYIDIWDNPSKDEVNGTDKAITVWMNNGADVWTGGGIGGLNINVNTYNSVSVMVYKQISGTVQLELQDGTNKVYLQKEYTTPGKWQKLVYDIPIGLGNITTLLVAPHLVNTTENPIPDGEAHRMWWDEVIAFYNPNATTAVFTKETLITSSGETLNYRKLIPAEIKTGEKYPLVIFLHGAGERGSDNSKQLVLGADLFAKNRDTYPAFVLFPQCPTKYFWPFNTAPASYDASTFPVDYPVSEVIKQVKELIDQYTAMDVIDIDRIYIAGLSMGGMGTFDIVCRYPDLFAAAIPICGGINVNRLTSEVTNVYWRIFHGDADVDVPVQNSRTAYNKLSALGAEVEYIEEAGVAHDVWNNAFVREDFLSWLFSKTKKNTSADVSERKIEDINIYQYNKILNIESNNVSSSLIVNIYSTLGTKLCTFKEIVTNNMFYKDYNLQYLNNGVYFVEIVNNEKRYVKKIEME